MTKKEACHKLGEDESAALDRAPIDTRCLDLIQGLVTSRCASFKDARRYSGALSRVLVGTPWEVECKISGCRVTFPGANGRTSAIVFCDEGGPGMTVERGALCWDLDHIVSIKEEPSRQRLFLYTADSMRVKLTLNSGEEQTPWVDITVQGPRKKG